MNKNLDAVNAVIKGVDSAGVQLVKALAVIDFPWLGLPIVNTIFGFALSWCAGYAEKAELAGASFLVIRHQVESEKAALSAALKAVTTAQQMGDKILLAKAIQSYALAQQELVNFREN